MDVLPTTSAASDLPEQSIIMELAQQAEILTSEIQQSGAGSRVDRQIAQSVMELNETMQVLRKRNLQTLSLEDQFRNIVDTFRRIREHDAIEIQEWKLDDDRYPQLESLQRAVDEAKMRLKMNYDVQWSNMMQNFKDRAATPSVSYSNADLTKFFVSEIEGWCPKEKIVKVSPRGTTVDLTLQNNEDKVRVRIALVDSFETAWVDLETHLTHISNSTNPSFNKPPRKPGEIRLDTSGDGPNPRSVWVYYNVLMDVELTEFKYKEPPAPNHPRSLHKSFHKFVDELFKHVRNGSVEKKSDVCPPNTQEIKSPQSIGVGELFDVEIIVDIRCCHSVSLDDDKLVCAGFEETERSLKYKFSATKAGEATIHFYFAHPDTLNFVGTDWKVYVK